MGEFAAGTGRTSRFTDKRDSVLHAASALFNERGVNGATLTDVAARVGLVKNSIPYYFRKKEDLAAACFMRAVDIYGDLIAQAAAQPGVRGRVNELFRLLAVHLVEIESGRQPALLRFHDLRALPRPQLDLVFAAYTDMFRRLRALLKGNETAGLTRDELNARGHILLSQVNGLRNWVRRHEPGEYGRIAGHSADIVIHGFAPTAAPWRDCGAEVDWAPCDEHTLATGAFLHAATTLINDEGFRGASVTKISERLNVTKGAFYYHNDNKDDLVTQCFERTFRIVREALQRAEESPGCAWDHLCTAARGLVRFQLSPAGPLLRLTATSALPDVEHRVRIDDSIHRLTQRAANLIADGVMKGSMRPLDASLAAQIALNGINAAAELQRWAHRANADNAAQLYVRPLLLGLLQPKAG